MKVFKGAFAAFAAAILACGIIATAQEPAPIPGPGTGPGPHFGSHRPPLERALGSGAAGRWWNDPAMVEKLSLSEDQRKSMDAILLEHREKLIDMHASVDKAELAMEPLISADQPSEQLILAQIDKIAQARAELEKANARFLLAIRAKLTPDQWKQLQTARAERHRNMPGHDNMRPRRHMMMPGVPPEGGPEGAPQAPPPPGPGAQNMIPQDLDPDFAPGPPPSAEAGAIE